jgi:Interferon-induced transmembrane protein/GYF domain 2
MIQWYYSKNGTPFGPVEQEEICAKLATGEIAPTDQVWRDGMANWLPAAQVPELANRSLVSPAIGKMTASPYRPPSVNQDFSPEHGGPPIPTYLWQSIVVTIFCCWPFGIPAIVNAAKVDGLKARGDYHGALAASADAKKWCMISVGLWVVFIGLGLVFGFISFVVRY